jgi:hypothetical protein
MLADGKRSAVSKIATAISCTSFLRWNEPYSATMAEWEDLRREARRLEASLEVSACFRDCNNASARNVILGSSLQHQAPSNTAQAAMHCVSGIV